MRIACLALLALTLFPAVAADEPVVEEQQEYNKGTLRLTAFTLSNIDTTLVARAESIPLGVFIDLSKDFGLTESETVLRVFFKFRFARRHQLDFDWFALNRDSTTTLERRIDIGEIVIEPGTTVELETHLSFNKLLYTWLFYDGGKVTLGASAGLNFFDFGLDLQSDPSLGEIEPRQQRTDVAAPLPVFGFRLNFATTPKLSLGFAADLLLVDIGDYSGTLQDIYVAFDYRLAKWFGLGAGINSLSLNLKVDNDDVLAEFRHSYRGFLGFVTFYF